MEYIDGDTLSNLRADKPRKVFEPDELTDWTSQLCDALDYAHTHARIVHRDLKPANLMVNQRGDLKVADFGIARSLSDSISMLTAGDRGKSGTLVYMSPQQLDGERGNHLDDVYSFGATMYELLTSKPPFSSGNVDRQIHEKVPPTMTQRRKDLEIDAGPVDEKWERTVAACLAKDPARRPQSILQVANGLELAAPGTRTGTSTAIYSKPTSNEMFITLGVAAVCLTLVGTWYFAIYQPGHRQERFPSPVAVTPSGTPVAPVSAAPTQAPTASTLGGVTVDTSPSGAVVTLSGMDALKSPVTFTGVSAGSHSMRIALDGYEPDNQQVEVKAGQFINLGTITLKPSKPPVEASSPPPGPKVIPNAVYAGTIRVKYESSATARPISITPAADPRSGIMTQSAKKGDMVVKYTGVWEGTTLSAVTNEVISKPPGVQWEPEAFTLHFGDDGKTATYECIADNKTYFAELSAQSLGSTAAKLSSVYKGAITGGTPLTINFGTDRKSGTMTQASKSGDVVVRFNGFWDGTILRAVTNEVVSKPPKVRWDPESFTLRFSEDGRTGSYECSADGRYYTAQLAVP
jgi:hypothetical protein